MRTATGLSLLAICFAASATEVPQNLMTASHISCNDYLSLPADGPEALRLEYWVAGRITAIAPASFQDELARISFKTMQTDLRRFCMANRTNSSLFEGSAILIYDYQRSPARGL